MARHRMAPNAAFARVAGRLLQAEPPCMSEADDWESRWGGAGVRQRGVCCMCQGFGLARQPLSTSFACVIQAHLRGGGHGRLLHSTVLTNPSAVRSVPCSVGFLAEEHLPKAKGALGGLERTLTMQSDAQYGERGLARVTGAFVQVPCC